MAPSVKSMPSMLILYCSPRNAASPLFGFLTFNVKTKFNGIDRFYDVSKTSILGASKMDIPFDTLIPATVTFVSEL
jgi:hypothetical protein